MGKGDIISGGENGLYQANSRFMKDKLSADIQALDASIAVYEAKVAEGGPEVNVNKSILFGMQKKKDELGKIIIEDEQISVWCADFTEDLTGDVGIIEVPGESVAFNIQPGYEGNAVWNKDRDGHLVKTSTMTPAQAFYSIAMLPGWQKWKPTYRYATITLMQSGNLANVTLEETPSTQQGLKINQTDTLENVPIEYMSCDSAAFSNGDSVLVKFEGQSWDAPKIIGFKDNPKDCLGYVYITGKLPDTGTYCIVWDMNTNNYATKIPLDAGGFASFPCAESAISVWRASLGNVGSVVLSTTSITPVSIPAPYAAIPEYITEEIVVTWDCISECPDDCYNNPEYDKIRTFDGTGEVELEGIDHQGNAGQTIFITWGYEQKEAEYPVKRNDLVTYDLSFNSPGIQGKLITSQTAGGQRSRTAASVRTLEKNYNACSTFSATDYEAIDYSVHSPFSDSSIKTFTHTKDHLIQSGVGSCSAYGITETVKQSMYGTTGAKSDQQMIIFYIEEVITKRVVSQCANIFIYGFSNMYLSCNGSTQVNCNAEILANDVITYQYAIDFAVTAFSHIVDSDLGEVINNINPFDIAENSQLGGAILGLKNYTDGYSSVPNDEECSVIVLTCSLLK
jgi:hypothetical protein